MSLGLFFSIWLFGIQTIFSPVWAPGIVLPAPFCWFFPGLKYFRLKGNSENIWSSMQHSLFHEVLSSSVFCHVKSSHLAFPEFSTLFLYSGRWSGSILVPFPCVVAWKLFTVRNWSHCRAHLIFFPFILLIVWCLKILCGRQNNSLLQSVHVLISKACDCYLIWQKEQCICD